jgi:hypothetical protein
MKIIAIQGFIGSGKDTLANLILNNNENSIKLSFASSLKDCISVVFNWNREMLEGDTKESREWREKIDEWWSKRLNIPHLTPRWVLQNWGTEVLRGHFHPDIWIASLENKIQNMKDINMIIITDCRFENEIECLKKLGALFIRIKRGPEPEWLEYYLNYDVKPNVHISEYSWIKNDFDITIENDGTVEDLKNFEFLKL